MSTTNSKSNQGLPRLGLLVLLGLPALGLIYFALRSSWWRESAVALIQGATVQRGPLLISIVARGDLSAADSVDLRSEVEGRTAILSLVPEGSHVEAGTVVCELDATALIEKRFQQSISLRNAEAAFVKAKQNFEIQQSQNRSDIAKAEQKLEFAGLDLDKYTEGERASLLEKAKQAIDLAKEDFTRAANKLDWSEKLADKGFLTTTELEADKISKNRAQVLLEQATRDSELLEKFQLPRKAKELAAAKVEATFELDRVKLQAKAKIVDFEADLSTNEAKLGLEREKLAKVESQIEKARLRAPRAGLVVYAQLDSDEPPIQEGTEVRERQVILSIPSASGMKAAAKLHESVLEQVTIGLPCSISVDALPGRQFTGKVAFVALLPDQNMRWSNPNARLYRTDIAIDASSADMRPGMSCAIKIRLEELTDVLFVPVQAVFREPRGTVSYVPGPRGIEARDVKIGRYNVENVQILAGLSEGETVLLSRPTGYDESGQAVKDGKPEPTTTAAQVEPAAAKAN